MNSFTQLLLALLIALTACAPPAQETKPEAALPPALSRADSLRQSLANLSDQIKKDPANYGLYHDRALVFFELDSLNAAISDTDAALSLYRNSPELHQLRGFFGWVKGDTARAEEEFLAAAGLGSRDPETYYHLGQIQFLRKQYPDARKYYETAISINDRDPQYPFALGLIEEMRNRVPQAMAYYQAAIRLDSTFSKAYDRLYDLHFQRQGKQADAQRWLDTWLRFAPGHPMARYYEGEAYRLKALAKQEERDAGFTEALNQAVASYSIAINVDPAFGQALYYRAECFAMAENYEAALADYQRVPQGHPFFAAAQFQLGAIAEYFNDFSGALDHYQAAARANPASKDALRAVAEMQKRIEGL